MTEYIASHSRHFINIYFYIGIALFPILASIFTFIGEKDTDPARRKTLHVVAMVLLVAGGIYIIVVTALIYLIAVGISIWEKGFIIIGVAYYLTHMPTPLRATSRILANNKPYSPIPSHKAIFISYRTTDVHMVRIIAEQLIARGLPIWFDEYYLMTSSKENILTNDDEFESFIKRAIDKSKSAICFTNRDYSSSKYCRHEISVLATKLSPSRILNVACPEHKELYSEVPALARSPKFELQHALHLIEPDILVELWKSVLHHCSIPYYPIGLRNESSMEVEMKWMESTRYSLDLGGWQGSKVFEEQPGAGLDIIAGRYKQVIGNLSLHLHICAGLYGGEHREYSTGENKVRFIVDGGKIWDKYMRLSPMMRDTKLIGTHFINIQGYGHAAFSTYDMQRDLWQRHYVIVFPNPVYERTKDRIDSDMKQNHPDYGTEIEISLQFTLMGGASFQDFCRIAYLMERVAGSLRLLPPTIP